MKRTELPLDVQAMEQARAFSLSDCSECVGQDKLCPACEDLRDVRVTNLAYSKVEQNLIEQEGDSYHNAQPEVSGHDWVASITRTKDGREREEFKESSYNIADRISGYRFLGQHMIDLRDDYDVTLSLKIPKGYAICPSCHFQYNLALPCQNH